MRIILAQSKANKGDSQFHIPVGLLCLASYIKQYGHKSVIIDLDLSFNKARLTNTFFKQIALKLLKHKPDVLGFGIMCDSLPAVLLIAKECKKNASNIPIILGGPEVSFEEVELLNTFEQVDIIVRGEGEDTLVEVLEALKNKRTLVGILGITCRENGKIVRNPDRPLINDLDTLPPIDYSLLPNMKKYKFGRVEAGRGCPFQCTFCSTCRMWKRTFRIKSPQRLVNELKEAHSVFGKTKHPVISIAHDHFLTSRKTAEEFLPLIAKEGVSWTCSSRLEALDANFTKKLSDAGCKGIILGIESASPEIQKKIKKCLPLSKLPQALEILSENGITANLSFIIGFPDESISQMDKTLQMALKSRLYNLSPNVNIYPFTYLKGSESYVMARDKFRQPKLWRINKSPLLTDLSAELSLINKYPHIFPSFLEERTKHFKLGYIGNICILFNFLIEVFPLTTLLLQRYLSATPLQLGNKLMSFSKSERAEFKLKKNSFGYDSHLLKKFITNKSDQLIKEVFMHEVCFNRLYTSSHPHHISASSKIGISSRPIIGKDVSIKTYSHDICALVEHLKNEQKTRIPTAECHLAYIPGKILKAVPLNPFCRHLISLCNGQMTVGQLVCKIFEIDPHQNRKEIAKRILNEIVHCQKLGIISISSPHSPYSKPRAAKEYA